MRYGLIALALLAVVALGTVSASAFEKPAQAASLVVRVADMDAPHHSAHGRADSYRHWRYRASYVRWLHAEYVRAGYPVRHPSRRTYRRW